MFDKQLKENLAEYCNEEGWLQFELYYKGELYPKTNLIADPFEGELLVPDEKAEFGVISDESIPPDKKEPNFRSEIIFDLTTFSIFLSSSIIRF